MNDPYDILGVSSRASDDEVKKAYRDLVRKYHPDNYHNNPLADLAQEKMKEINEAYDVIMRSRESGSGSGSSNFYRQSTGGAYSSSSGSTNESARIRVAINSGNIRLAEQLLESFSTRNAEWNFLMGSVHYRKGWLDDARRYFQTAVSMDPSNPEYRHAMNMMNQSGSMYRRPAAWQTANRGMSPCDLCTAMMCMNMFCRCR
ncbi:MAG: DnaJ domain-containing protein [Oscillospiraceae bacterium]|nr:DnaJ domain-containing protein [Oscillospiraceae bacterium]